MGQPLIEPNVNIRANPNRRARYNTIRKNIELLKYAIGKTRYTQALKNVDLSNLIVYYGTRDQNVGVLSAVEIDFLKHKNASLVGVETDHYNIWKRVIDDLEAGHWHW